MSTAVRRQAEETAVAAPQFIPPKIGYALKPQTKVAKPTAAAQPDDSKDDIVPGFIPPKMPFVAKTYQQQKSTNEQASPQRLASVASVNDNKKTAAKDSKNSKVTKTTKDNKDTKSTKDTKNTKNTKNAKTNNKNASPQKLAAQDNADDDKLPSFIPPRSPFRGPKKPQPTQSVPRDTVPQFIPPKNPWLPSKFNTRSANGDIKAASQETAIPDSEQRASRADLLKRDEEDEANVDFEEEDDDEFSPSDFPNLGDFEDEESNDVENHDSKNLPTVNMSEQQAENEETNEAHNQDSANIPVVNVSEEQAESEEAVNVQDEDDAKNYFGGDFDDEDASSAPTRLEARGVAKRNMIYFTNW